jgi:hypothetical protein
MNNYFLTVINQQQALINSLLVTINGLVNPSSTSPTVSAVPSAASSSKIAGIVAATQPPAA